MQVINELGPWNWFVLGLLLIILEIIAPGVFMLWIGLAALVTGLLSLALWATTFWGWPIQIAVFAVLAIISVLVARSFFASRQTKSDQPLLNRRGAQLVGRTAVLTEPIKSGKGRIKLGDTMWRVSGPDLPVGAQVKVVDALDNDLELVVEPI